MLQEAKARTALTWSRSSSGQSLRNHGCACKPMEHVKVLDNTNLSGLGAGLQQPDTQLWHCVMCLGTRTHVHSRQKW